MLLVICASKYQLDSWRLSRHYLHAWNIDFWKYTRRFIIWCHILVKFILEYVQFIVAFILIWLSRNYILFCFLFFVSVFKSNYLVSNLNELRCKFDVYLADWNCSVRLITDPLMGHNWITVVNPLTDKQRFRVPQNCTSLSF